MVGLFFLLIIGGLWRFHNLDYPSNYLFDEHYHIPTAKLMAQRDPRAYEWWHGELDNEISGSYIDWLHPPLHKYWQALNIRIWGNNSWAWRLSSAISGTLLIAAVFWVAKIFFKKNTVALLSAAFVAFEPMLIVQSKIGMNDMLLILLTVMGVGCWQQWRTTKDQASDGWWLTMSVVFGLAAATKWSVALIAPVILMASLGVMKKSKKWRLGRQIKYLMITLLTICLVYLASYGPMFWQGKNLTDFGELHRQIWRYQTQNSSLTHAYSSRPAEWVWGEKELIYTTRPEQQTPIVLQDSKIFLGAIFINSGLILILLVASIFLKKNKVLEKRSSLGLCWLLYSSSFLPWLFSPRPMFLYHYLPALPWGIILLSWTIVEVLGLVNSSRAIKLNKN